MKRRALLVAVLLVLAGGVALAQSGGGYDLIWSSVDGGGGTLHAGGGYTLSGTLGQPDAGQATGSGYTLGGGFWGGGEVGAPAYESYLPLVVR